MDTPPPYTPPTPGQPAQNPQAHTPPPMGGYQPPLPAESTSGMAIASMILGLLGLLTFLPAIPAVILGHVANGKIKRSGGRVGGGGMALTGLITGYIMIAFMFMMVPLAAISSPIILRQIAKARATQAISNSKDIYMNLRDYSFSREAQQGKLPGVQGDGLSANTHLRVLFNKDFCFDESPFYVKGVEWARPGDQLIDGDSALSSGENVFGYVPGVNIITDEAKTPLLISPLKHEGGRVVIDTQVYGGQLVVLSADGACRAIRVSPKGDLDGASGYAFDNGVISFISELTGELVELQVAMPER